MHAFSHLLLISCHVLALVTKANYYFEQMICVQAGICQEDSRLSTHEITREMTHGQFNDVMIEVSLRRGFKYVVHVVKYQKILKSYVMLDLK